MDSTIRSFLILKGLLLLTIGCFFMVKPDIAARGISIYLGLVLLAGGSFALWNLNRLRRSPSFSRRSFIAPIFVIVSGFLLLFFSKYVLIFLALAAGLIVLTDGLSFLRNAGTSISGNRRLGRWLTLLGVLLLLIGVVVVLNPYDFVKLATIAVGVSMFLSGLILFFFGLRAK